MIKLTREEILRIWEDRGGGCTWGEYAEALNKAQIKKIVDAFRQQEGEEIDSNTIYRISERTLRDWENEGL